MDPQPALTAFDGLVDPVATPISTGLLHETYEVRDSGDRQFILQRINPIFSPGVNHNIRAVTEHLSERGVETFSLIPCHGEPYVDLGPDGLWRLMTRIRGTSFDHPESTEQLCEAGRLVASFHRALFDFDAALHPIGFAFHDTSQHFDDLSLALQECGDHVFHSEISVIAEELVTCATALPSFAEIPRRVIHGDLKFNNLLFEPARSSEAPCPIALIDLDTVSRMPLAFDWGDALRSWCNRRAENEPRADLDLSLVRAACEGLMTAFDREPDAPELESLGWGLEIMSLELSARFATDALRECYFAWDKEKYERAGAQNRDRALGQLDLFRQARETHGERARLLST